MKGQMLGSRSLEDDISLAHSVYASSLQSEVSGRKMPQSRPPLTPTPPPLHAPLANDRPLVAGTGLVPTVSVAWSGPLAPLGFSFFLRQVRGWAS